MSEDTKKIKKAEQEIPVKASSLTLLAAVAGLALLGANLVWADLIPSESTLPVVVAADSVNNAAVAAAIAGLAGDNPFQVRQAATNQLWGWVKGNQLTAQQLGTIRAAVGSTDLEVSLRAGQIMAEWEASVPGVLGLVNATMVTSDSSSGKTVYQIGNVFLLATPKSTPIFNDLLKLYEVARNSLLAGAANDVQKKFQALRDAVANLTADELTALAIDNIAQQSIVNQMDAAIKTIPATLKSIGDGTTPQGPPMQKMGALMPSGAADSGATFGLNVNGSFVPGTFDMFMPDYEFASAGPPAGYQFVGELFDLVEANSLDLTGSTVSVSLQYGPGLDSGNPINPDLPLCLVRLANGATTFLNCANSTGETELTGSYQPESEASGAIQLGEFALVQPVPEPASLVLLGTLIGVLCFVRRTQAPTC